MSFYATHKYRPRTRHMYLEEDRLESFHCKSLTGRFIAWPKSLKQSPKSLAKSGFFYTGYSDIVICFYCDLHLMSWDPSDSPTIEHCRHSPYCSFMTHKHGIKYMNFFKPFSQVATWELELKFTKISEKTFKITERKNAPQTKLQPTVSLTNIQPKFIKNTPTYTKLHKKYLKLQAKHLLLKARLNCTVCMATVKDTIFMPCAHLATCLNCATQLYDCPICRTPIKFISSAYT